MAFNSVTRRPGCDRPRGLASCRLWFSKGLLCRAGPRLCRLKGHRFTGSKLEVSGWKPVLRLPLAQSFSCWRLLLRGQSANTKCCITSHGSGSDFLRHHGHDNINNGVLLPKPVDHEIPVVRAPCEITAALFLPILRTFRRRPAKPRRSKPRQPAHLRLGLWGNSRRPAGRRPRRAFPLLHLLRNPSGLSSSIP